MSLIWRWFIGPIAGPAMGIALVLVLIGGGAIWTFQRLEIGRLSSDLAKLMDDIDNPTTGWVKRLDRCETNVEGVKLGLEAANASIKALHDASEAHDAENKAALSVVAASARGAKVSADKVLALPRTTVPGTLEACFAGEKFLRGE